MIEENTYALPATLALKKTPGFIHGGWHAVRVEDLGSPKKELCTYCMERELRFVHILEHPEWPQLIRVGCVCACKLTGDDTPKEMESAAKRKAARRDRFIQTGWKATKNGNPYKTYRGTRVVICSGRRYLSICIDGKFGKRMFRDQTAAMSRAFDYIERDIK